MKYKTNTILIAMIIAFLNINISSAQILATTNDFPADNNVYNVENTGNDIVIFDQGFINVTVWDGDHPKLGWGRGNNPEPAFSLNGVQYGQIEDPDVVLQEVNNKLYAFVIYLIQNDVYIEIHEFSNGIWSLYQGATPITTSGNCNTPNVDIDNQNHLAAVWQDGVGITVMYSDILYSFPSILTLYSGSSVQTYRDPDVAVFPNSNMNIVVTYILEETTLQNQDQNLRVERFAWYSTVLNDDYNYRVYAADYFGKPRISADYGGTNTERYEIVTTHFGQTFNKILGFNYDVSLASLNGPTLLNTGFEHDYNSNPAVSYIGTNRIAVTWTHEAVNTQYDILLNKLDGTGSILNSSNFYFVNKSLTDDQTTSSVSGRYSGGHDANYSFFDVSSNSIHYKISDIFGSSVRLARNTDKSLIYPNPAKNYFYLDLTNLGANEAQIIVYDVKGLEVINTHIDANQLKIDITYLKQGVYFVKINSNSQSIIKKLIIN